MPQSHSASLSTFRAVLADETGGYSVVAAIMVPVWIGLTGFACEAGLWLYSKRTMQGASDLAAVSGATAGKTSAAAALAEAKAVAASIGFVDGTGGAVVTVSRPPTQGAYAARPTAVEVTIVQDEPRWVSALWNATPVRASVRSVALPIEGGGCVLALNRTTSGAVTIQGTSDVRLSQCGLYDNSASASALVVGGSATLRAQSVDTVGGISGSSAITATDGMRTGSAVSPDPYATATFPPRTGCTANSLDVKGKKTLSPGVYCNGLSFNANAEATLEPGIYYIDRGSLTVNGGATITGTGVTLVFTSSTGSNYATAAISGGASVNLSAPTSGPLAGIAVFADRNMPVGTTFKFNGGSTQSIQGAIYVPTGKVDYAGGAGAGGGCTQLVADTITFSGNAQFELNCSGRGTRTIGGAGARLVE
ncbi:TadE/TadG family type IV pilus assembly protein [Prosthecomicrobium sp. N25]|uniref:TadE/TadG family type IV pilus assembly protein n=1 Tax=Prosthecomicrobium sp. N25 TaxID=3129254 RepID=UPI003077A204